MRDSLRQFSRSLDQDDGLRRAFEADPKGTVQRVAQGAIPDNRVYRMVIGALGAAMLFSIVFIGVGVLRDGSFQPPEFLVASVSTIIGALVGLLSSQRREAEGS